MDPAHRDRIAFVRVVSGRYVKGMSAHHSRLGKEVRLAKPSQFMAAERTAIEDAWPGDVIGLFDPGLYRIGDTLAEGGPLEHECGANILLDKLPYSHARWVVGKGFEAKQFDWEGNRQTVQDRDGLPLVLFRDDWALQHAEEKHPELSFLSAAPQLHAGAAV